MNGCKTIEMRVEGQTVYKKYAAREGGRERDFVNKLVAGPRRMLPNSIPVFEDLDKGNLVSREWLKRGGIEALERLGGAYTGEYQEAALTAFVNPENAPRASPYTN
jgi:hypothetical protein